MKRKNFPERKRQRRIEAAERMRESIKTHEEMLRVYDGRALWLDQWIMNTKRDLHNTERKIHDESQINHRTKKNRSSRGD